MESWDFLETAMDSAESIMETSGLWEPGGIYDWVSQHRDKARLWRGIPEHWIVLMAPVNRVACSALFRRWELTIDAEGVSAFELEFERRIERAAEAMDRETAVRRAREELFGEHQSRNGNGAKPVGSPDDPLDGASGH